MFLNPDLQERFGEQQLAALLKSKAAQIFAFALQLPLLTYGDRLYTDPVAVASAFREVASGYEWADTRKFVSRHFRETWSQTAFWGVKVKP